MNVEKAKAIPLTDIMHKLGINPAQKRGNDVFYLSPFRNEKTASFKINTARNVWFDFGEEVGGGTIAFVRHYLKTIGEDYTTVDILRWLRNMNTNVVFSPCVVGTPDKNDSLHLKKVTGLQHPSLIDYLKSRNISVSAAKKYCKEIHVFNQLSGKSFFAIGLQNENGGYELRNEFFKGTFPSKGVTLIRGSKVLPEEVHIFEGSFDFLTALTYQDKKQFEGDVIILHSTCNLSRAFPYIANYSYKKVFSWLDNDEAGRKAILKLDDFLSSCDLSHIPMNDIYRPHKDVNNWFTSNHR
ncbi:toprim domain-containing protein [Ferruginibacter albus]|uniref:toprim domain-containing protein n=1 Tax=Ferruginibacter albus TaxID=2875540 RepID=UPI001CC64709|nr:toprim domain-containing protein [Ferruginibacter albus]UAY53193.1 toprim domain-containing protein [Ferruginibacter albus]